MNVIFIAGVHAVGKSTSCKVVSERMDIPHYSASELIREARSSALSDNTKLVADIADNQHLLIQSVSPDNSAC